MRGVLVVVVVAVLSWHGFGLWTKVRPLDAAAASAQLAHGTVDRAERLRCWAVLRDSAAVDARGRVQALTAAIALDDEAGFRRLLGAAGPEAGLFGGTGKWPDGEAEARVLAEGAAHGEAWLQRLLFAGWLRAAGDERASAELAWAKAAAQRREMSLAAELATAGQPTVGR